MSVHRELRIVEGSVATGKVEVGGADGALFAVGSLSEADYIHRLQAKSASGEVSHIGYCAESFLSIDEVLIKPIGDQVMVGHHVGPAVFAAFADD